MSKKVVNLTRAIGVLEAGRQVIDRPNSWIKGWFAKDNQGNELEAIESGACRFCTVGAIYKAHDINSAEYSKHKPPVALAFDYLGDAMSTDGGMAVVPDVNDHPKTKHKHVLMSFDFAILMAKDDLKAAKKKEKLRAAKK